MQLHVTPYSCEQTHVHVCIWTYSCIYFSVWMCVSVYQASINWTSQSVWMCVPYQCFQSVWMCVPCQCLTRTGECGLSVCVEKGMKVGFTSWCQLRVHVWNQFNACNKCLKSKLWRWCKSVFTTLHCTFTYSWVVCCTIYSATDNSCGMFAASLLNWITYLFLSITLTRSQIHENVLEFLLRWKMKCIIKVWVTQSH